MSAAPARDPYLELPLDGVRLIEASAGTGKTFTLATLVTRLVVERGLRVGQVLAVTFTEAATQELRKRIRERLLLALDLVDAAAVDDEDAEAALTRDILQAHLASSGERPGTLRRRLREAALEIDLAAIFTIHGFCARVLREHALESGQGFDPPELLGNDRGLREELAADLWRTHGRDAAGAEDLAALWKGGPPALAADLGALMREPMLVPPDAPLSADPTPAMLEAGRALADGFRAHGPEFLAVLLDALERKVLNGQSYKAAWIQSLWTELAGWCEAGDYAAPLDERLARLTAQAMQGKTNKAHVGRTPQSPLCGLIDTYLQAVAGCDAWRVRRRIALLHRIRGDARERLAMLKRQRRLQTYDDMIDGVADALDAGRGDALVRSLRARYSVALVDEFQDTDPRQWKIFNRVFGSGSEAPALFLVGDPKQAIYGFRGGDVHTYLGARDTADEAPPLAHNFRSRPSVLAAIEALYRQAGEEAFVDPRIRFRAVDAGGTHEDEDFQRGGVPAPALTIWRAPDPGPNDKGEVKPWKADASREHCTAACVAAIHAVLSEGRAGSATIEGEPVQPGDIAVLVRTHGEATRIQQALAAVGIPAVAAGKQSLFATLEARELHALLLALLQSGDDGRLRAALSSVLVGVDAAAIAAFDGSDHDWRHKALAWRERLLRGGPLALVGDLCAEHAPRLLGLTDGERRVGNYLQLAEALQEAQAETLGLHGLVDWLGTRIANADPDDEAQLLRLESDARRVQIVTLHKSKGLEYPLVFLPFAGIGRPEPSPGSACVAQGGDDNERRLHWKLEVPEAEWDDARQAWSTEQHAEHARLLYVGLTRARHALWLASGLFYNGDKAALAPMLADLDALQAVPCIHVDTAAPPALPRLAPESDAAVPPAAMATRVLSSDWWVHSFSSLTRKTGPGEDASTSATLPAPGGRDESAAAEDEPVPGPAYGIHDPRFAGAQFGVAMHAALERTDFAAWRAWLPGDPAPGNEAATIADALREQGYAEDLLEDGIALVTSLVGRTLRVVLPEGVQLCNVPGEWRRPELEFQFPLRPTRVDALLQLLHAHDVVPDRHAFGFRQRLEGLMTGLVDLTYLHDGRWYVLDYKSNRLPRYDEHALREAMQHSEYDLQALVYTLALHRWLRFRLGDGYDYRRDFGGHRYVFSRGIELDAPAQGAPAGVHARKFDPALVHALDALFAGEHSPLPLAGEGQVRAADQGEGPP